MIKTTICNQGDRVQGFGGKTLENIKSPVIINNSGL